MDKNGHNRSGTRRVVEVPFYPSVGTPQGIEICDFQQLVERAAGHGVNPYRPTRPRFHHLIALESGRLRHSVDLTDCLLEPGDWLWVRPGQTHQFHRDLETARGIVVFFPPGFLDSATVAAAHADLPGPPRPLCPAPADSEALDTTLALLVAEYHRRTELPHDVHVEIARHLLAALLLRLAHLHDGPGGGPAGGEVFTRFRAAVERDFARAHRVEDYARSLGYSVRTLTRATVAATGHGAKHYIDDRIVLEAKRLLVHTDLSAAAVGSRVGLPDARAFTRFFRQRTGETPGGFRIRAAGGSDGPSPV
ncbi:helix-turn-helix domain-containing protein [Nocardia miyunensis]|uniref:helix-turn-helix domain-containing protein n=1 Tax=Nocardia miyunensis TaxID=282684 RepID=UPI000830021A|nr:AraC family transcriptional regulator [Nocardia miyunensis]